MITCAQLALYQRLKLQLAACMADPTSGFQPSQRHLSEGLSRSLMVGGNEWTYSTVKGGYRFCYAPDGYSVLVSEQAQANHHFTTSELVYFLTAFPATHNVNEVFVDMWLVRAAIRGEVESVPQGWRLAARTQAHAGG